MGITTAQILGIAGIPADLLHFPSPSLPAPANWIIPAILYLALLKYFVSLIRSEHLTWLWNQIRRFTSWLQEPAPTPTPSLGNILGKFSGVVVYSMFAIWFLLYGLSILLMGVSQLGKNTPASVGIIVLGFIILAVGSYYRSLSFKGSQQLSGLWAQYSGNKTVVTLTIAIVTVAMITVGWIVTAASV